mmetsp:Transcript_28245/g.75578  ORF Transcript_28245/g.75578 Transcript_28245/m.75578 type:complete len:236 (+) Transcript_28245:115-822(+)
MGLMGAPEGLNGWGGMENALWPSLPPSPFSSDHPPPFRAAASGPGHAQRSAQEAAALRRGGARVAELAVLVLPVGIAADPAAARAPQALLAGASARAAAPGARALGDVAAAAEAAGGARDAAGSSCRARRVLVAVLEGVVARLGRRGGAGDAGRVVRVRLHLRELLGRSGLQQRRLLAALGALAFRAHLLGGERRGEEGHGQDGEASHADLGPASRGWSIAGHGACRPGLSRARA